MGTLIGNAKVYRRESGRGRDENLAFDDACREVRLRAPKPLLSIVVRIISILE